MANDNDNKKQRRRPNELTANDVADLFQSAAWYAAQNGVAVSTETGAGGLVIRLPTLQAVTGADGAVRFVPLAAQNAT